MSTETQNRAKTAGKVEERKQKFYGNIDLSNLDYLDHRDITRVADKLQLHVNTVSKVKRIITKNSDVMAALLKIGGERRKSLQTAAA